MKIIVTTLIFILITFGKCGYPKSFFEVERECSLLQVLEDGSKNTNQFYYRFQVNKNHCKSLTNCWISFSVPEDQFEVFVESEEVLVIDRDKSYFANEILTIPVKLEKKDNIIEILGFDVNQKITAPSKLCIVLGPLENIRFKAAADWFLKTGITLYSAYFLLICFVLLLFSAFFSQTRQLVSLLLYCLTSFLYLLSFSEYPRAIFDPVLFSGGVHFPLRLLQDMMLIFVIYTFNNLCFIKKIIYSLFMIYGVVIGLYALCLSIGLYDYIYYERIIKIMAPLVAMPMALALLSSFYFNDKVERMVMIPSSVLLFIFQLNDLFLFWGIVSSYYTVKFYIPFIIVIFLFLYFRRIHEESKQLKQEVQKRDNFREFVHDIKSPLAVLHTIANEPINNVRNNKFEIKNIFKEALSRIENMAYQLDSEELSSQKLLLDNIIKNIIDQKRIEHPDFEIKLGDFSGCYIYGDSSKVYSILSNLLNNAYQAYNSNARTKYCEVKIIQANDLVKILITDYGKGMSKDEVKQLGNYQYTSKEHGKGIGLYNAKTYLNKIGGDISFYSKKNHETTVEITIPLVLGEYQEFSSNLEIKSKEIKSYDWVQIDDDPYIRQAWTFYAENASKELISFETLENFFDQSKNINKDAIIYLDINLGGERSLDKVEKIRKLGFVSIYLSTGEDVKMGQLPEGVVGVIGKIPPTKH